MKKSYITPSEKIAVLDVEELIAESLNANGLDDDFEGFGGNTGDNSILDADVKRRNLWDEIW